MARLRAALADLLAIVAYGEPRFTMDMDVLHRHLDAARLDAVAARLNALGVWRALWEENTR